MNHIPSSFRPSGFENAILDANPPLGCPSEGTHLESDICHAISTCIRNTPTCSNATHADARNFEELGQGERSTT